MKNMLRASGLVTVLVLTALSTVNAQAPGTCRTACVYSSGQVLYVTRSVSESTCCSPTFNPCPSGTTPSFSWWTPTGGIRRICP
jgi:hypothetical protein